MDLDEIDSVEFDQALAATFDENEIDGDGDEDSHSMDIFSGVDANSTDELDEFLSQEASPFKENVAKKIHCRKIVGEIGRCGLVEFYADSTPFASVSSNSSDYCTIASFFSII